MRIVAHTDFDGLASAALVSMATSIDDVVFTRPDTVDEVAEEGDIVVDLPYTPKASVWLDHHASQTGRVQGITYEGELDPTAPCAAVVVARYYELAGPRVDRILELARATDQFRMELPDVRRLTFALEYRQDSRFLLHILRLVRDEGMDAVFTDATFLKRLRRFTEEREAPTLKLLENGDCVTVCDGRIALVDVPDRKRYSSKVAELALYEQGIDLVITVTTHTDGRGRLSFGTNPDRDVPFDCSRVASALGGGGHPYAAGASFDPELREGTVERLKELITEECARQGIPLPAGCLDS
ncbi:MAG: DHHA1 domain-containing protein [Candidatus Undinarchaeales archaeon]|nr:DHHA1 domain-containing protein [Candidatus Undinarchaeales archaeon]MDP7491486.1 DHHA1 domain-containing protein [Candidatus Undinarchaeales archaeon]